MFRINSRVGASFSVGLPMVARLSEPDPKINRLSRLIEALLCRRSEAIESARRRNALWPPLLMRLPLMYRSRTNPSENTSEDGRMIYHEV